jgi:hypothetical protein
MALLIVLFAVTRLFLFHGAVSETYRGKSGDVGLYTNWATAIVDHNQAPYSGFSIEYPPVIPAFVTIPEIGRAEIAPYYERFVKLMLLIDILCFACVLLLARKWGSLLGPLIWIFGSLLLGPISYVRLDLLPALITLLVILCIAYGWWRAAGGWLAFGALTKVYPLFLAPILFAYSPRRKHVVIGAVVVAALVLFPYIGSLDDMWRSVVTYHTDRGLETGSTWAGLIYLLGRSGYEFSHIFAFGSTNVGSSISDGLKTLSLVLSVVVLVGGSILAFWEARRDASPHRIPVSMLAMLMLLMFTGTVLSPQFIIWPVALASAALCHKQDRHITLTMSLLLPIALLTQLVFRYAGVEEPPGLIYLTFRNLLLLFMGVELFIALRRSGAHVPEAAPARLEEARALTP